MDIGNLLRRTAEQAIDYLDTLPDRPVGRPVDAASLRASLGGPLPETPSDAATVLDDLVQAVDPGLVATAGPRYFGFVVGGAQPAALAADWLAATWDQNAAMYALSPAAAVVEEVTAGWLVELFGLPAGSSVGFTSGATMANFTALAAGRHAILAAQGWDVEGRGLIGAPDLPVVVGGEAHVTILASLQMLGLGRDRVITVPVDGQGRMRADELRRLLAELDRPAIVCAQAGNVNTGAFDPLPAIAAAAHEHRGWLHVDGAFGLWAAASPSLAPLVDGLGDADSWTTDAHKWLNVPYDSGIVAVRDAAAHHAAMTLGAAYYVETAGADRDGYNWVPESSRRARALPIYASLRSMSRAGLADLLDGSCRLARRFAERLRGHAGIEILNDMVLNQVLVRFSDPDGTGADERTRAVVAAVQRDGTAWMGGTTWQDQAAMRISVSNWSTTDEDVDRTVDAILRAAAAAGTVSAPA